MAASFANDWKTYLVWVAIVLSYAMPFVGLLQDKIAIFLVVSFLLQLGIFSGALSNHETFKPNENLKQFYEDFYPIVLIVTALAAIFYSIVLSGDKTIAGRLAFIGTEQVWIMVIALLVTCFVTTLISVIGASELVYAGKYLFT